MPVIFYFAWHRMLALTPLIFGLLGSVLLHLLPQLKPVVVGVPLAVASLPSSVVSAARDAWDRVPSFSPKAHRIEKCFLARCVKCRTDEHANGGTVVLASIFGRRVLLACGWDMYGLVLPVQCDLVTFPNCCMLPRFCARFSLRIAWWFVLALWLSSSPAPRAPMRPSHRICFALPPLAFLMRLL